MTAFTGTWRLIRLALRLDRLKLSVWIVGIVGAMGASASALGNLYDTVEQQTQYAATTAPSVVGRAFGGLVNGPSIGSIAMVELFYFTAILMAFMGTLTVIRHTRKPEESGAGELIGSGVVGRYASLSAAISVAVLANLVVAAAMCLVLNSVEGISLGGAFGFSLALALTGVAFAGIAGITAQLSESSRGANSMAGGAIGLAFVLRAVGDGMGQVAPDGLSASAHWLSWLSPLGWGFQIHPLTEQNWWIFSLLVGFMAISVVGAFFILRHRDVGLGIIPTRAGKASASRNLANVFGLSWRLQRATLIGWGVGFVVFGLAAGGMAHEFSDFLSQSPETAEILASIGGDSDSIIDVFFGAMFSFAGITAAGYVIQSLIKLRSEETAGHLEALLSTKLGRGKWMLSHFIISVAGTLCLMLIMGVVTGLVHVMVSGEPASEILRLVQAMMVQAPALLVFAGVVAFLFGIRPRFTAPVAWAIFAGSFLILQLGTILNLPEWVTNVSPFSHTPPAPAESLGIETLAVFAVAAAAFTIFGFISFRKRDLTTTA